MDLTQIKEKLAKFDQSHLLDFWDQLNEEQKSSLYNELNKLDVEEVVGFFNRTVSSMNDAGEKVDDRMEPLCPEQRGSLDKCGDEDVKQYEKLSYEAISQNKLGILLLAGGQGTRLGVSYPKGMYDVGLPSKKTLFQLQAERILKLERLAEETTGKRGYIAWYVMTSASTIKPTREFFLKNNYFGLKAENVVFFEQGTLPCFTFGGKIIMSNKFEIARAPDGNGGLYRALRNEGILADMAKRGVEYVQLYCVDNILVRVGDPVFGGYCISKGAECANKVVVKGSPNEAVGVTCKVDGKYKVVEYSEITSKSAELRDTEGNLVYSAGNICIHFFTRQFLDKVVNQHEPELVHHIAKKKIPFVDEEGNTQKPERPNGIKMEKFVFDVFEFADNFVVWECVREDEFAPLKNADGAADSTPTACKRALFALHQKWLKAAGAAAFVDGKTGEELPLMRSPAALVVKDVNENEDAKTVEEVTVEISPLVSYAGEGLRSQVEGKALKTPITFV